MEEEKPVRENEPDDGDADDAVPQPPERESLSDFLRRSPRHGINIDFHDHVESGSSGADSNPRRRDE
jgi:hypothetical protein